MELKNIENIVVDIIKNYNLKLYELNYIKDENIIQVLLDSTDETSIDFTLLEKINNLISLELDKLDELNYIDNYYLEVSSSGIEKEVKDITTLINHVGNYFFIQTNDIEFNGYLDKYLLDELVFKVNQKGKFKKISIKKDDIIFIRHSIKV